MADCNLHATCTAVRDLLSQMGATDDIATDCSEVGPCQSVFENAHQATLLLNLDNVKAVEQFLLKIYDGVLPFERSPAAAKQIFNQRPFVCPELDIEIRQPCRVSSCTYWTDHAWTRNCILYYRFDQHRESLDIKDLTFLLGPSSSEIRKQTNRAIAELRKWALHYKTEQLNENQKPAAVNKDCCVVCGQETTERLFKHGHQYCGQKCYEQKPPVDFRIEQEFNLPVPRVLEICIDSFAAKRPMCHALSVTVKQLDQLCGRYSIEIASLS